MPALESMGRAMGMKALIEILRKELPDVEIGNFTRPVKRDRGGAAREGSFVGG